MTYTETVNWMFQQLPMYQNQGKTAYKKDLTNTLLLAEHLNNPERDFKSIHVAGTNGKGSTSHMLASVLQEAGYKVGLYTSPHLKDYRERIKINGKDITEDFVVAFIEKHQNFLEANNLSFFEMTVGMAFSYFSEEKVDIAIIEVGLGGRLDSTNIITSEVSVITNIGLDHTQFLGNTLEAIAKEKGGIIKSNVPVVIGETQEETQDVFKVLAKTHHSTIYFADETVINILESDLVGNYQQHNIKTVIKTIDVLCNRDFLVTENQLKNGLLHVVKNTNLKGRWQVLQNQPKIVCDTAHNKEGLIYIVEQLKTEVFDNLHIVFGVVNDKDLSSILHLLPKKATYYFCKPNIFRGLDAEVLQSAFLSEDLHGEVYLSVNEALMSAKANANPEDFIYIGGSTFVVAEII